VPTGGGRAGESCSPPPDAHRLAPNLFVIRFWLGKRVIQSYVDGVDESLVRVELGDNHAIAVLIEHVTPLI
jgi:hypothetical protein